MKKDSAAVFRYILAAALAAACLLASGCSGGDGARDQGAKEGREEPSYEQISQEEALRIMQEEEGYIILDVRTLEEFSSGHIPGAVSLPNESIGTEEIAELPDKDQLILVYCRSGNRSKQASQKLAELGYTDVKEFGGINTWPGETVTD